MKEKTGNYILVQGDEKAKKIMISAYGDEPRGFLSYVRGVFDNQLHNKIANLKTVEYIPLPDKAPNGETRFAEYENLLGMWRQGIFEYPDGIVGQRYSIPDLLGRFESWVDSREKMERGSVVNKIYIDNDNRNENSNISKSDATTDVNVAVSVEVKTNISLLIGGFNDVKDELLARAPELATDLAALEKRLAALEQCGGNKEAMIKSGAMNGVRRFLESLGDENSKLGKTLKGIEKGHEIFSDLAQGYNAVADWLGFPQVPKVLLKNRG